MNSYTASANARPSDVAARSPFGRYAALILGGLAIYLLAAATINFYVDPWELYGPLRYKVVPRSVNFERVTLAHNIRLSKKFEVLFLGSSRVRYLLSDGTGRVHDQQSTAPFFGTSRVFNAALAGANMHQMRRVLEHALHYHPVRELVFLVDDIMLNAHRPLWNGWYEYNYFGSPDYQTALERALSLADVSMLESSVHLLLANRADAAPPPLNHGALVIRADAAPPPLDPRALVMKNIWEDGIKEFSRRDMYGCFEIGPEPRRELDLILSLAERNNVRVTLIASLVHPSLFEYLYRSDEGRAIGDVLSIMREAALNHGVPAWYFSPFSAVTRGTPRTNYALPEFYDGPDFYDPGHANYLISRKILEHALSGIEHSDLRSYRLNERTAKEVLHDLRLERQIRIQEEGVPFADFLAAHPLIAGQACPVRGHARWSASGEKTVK